MQPENASEEWNGALGRRFFRAARLHGSIQIPPPTGLGSRHGSRRKIYTLMGPSEESIEMLRSLTANFRQHTSQSKIFVVDHYESDDIDTASQSSEDQEGISIDLQQRASTDSCTSQTILHMQDALE